MALDAATPVSFVSVRDRDAGLVFYGNVLRLKHRSADAFGDFFEMGSGLLRMTALPDFEAQPQPVLGWDVPDIAAAVADLRARGIDFTVHDGMGQDPDGIWHAPEGGPKVAWFADPFGNVLSLSQTSPAS